MITEDKVIEIFCMADDFCKFFDAMMAKYTLTPSKAEISPLFYHVKSGSYDDYHPFSCFGLSLSQTLLS
jgi:hypothetical protein